MKNETLKKIGLRIKQLRRENGLTQTDLAKKVGYTEKSSISYIEHGRIDLPLSKLEAFAQVFNCSLAHIVDFSHLNIKSGGKNGCT